MEADSKPTLDLAELRELYGEELLLTLLLEFRKSVPGMLQCVGEAVAESDASTLFQTAHRLKSAVSNLYSDGAGDAAARLERMGRYNDLSEATAALRVLQHELARLLTAVDEAIGEVREQRSSPE